MKILVFLIVHSGVNVACCSWDSANGGVFDEIVETLGERCSRIVILSKCEVLADIEKEINFITSYRNTIFSELMTEFGDVPRLHQL